MNKKVLIGLVIAVLAVAGIIVAVLSKKDTNKTTGATTTQQMNMNNSSQTATGTKTDQNAPNATNQVKIENFTFSPIAITVKKGTTVTWTNKDSAAHTVTGDKGEGGPSSGTLRQGDTYTFTYNTVGTFAYHCNFHSNMSGTVVVTE